MASFKNLYDTFMHFSRNFTCPLSKSRTQGFFTLLLTLAILIFFYSSSDNTPPMASTTVTSRLHKASNYISSLSSVPSPNAIFISNSQRSCTDAATLSAVTRSPDQVSRKPRNCYGAGAVTFSAMARTQKGSRKSGNGDMKDAISCDIFDGRWVADDSEPLYRPGSCPFVDDAFNCFKNGRPDSDYLRLRWQPHGCDIPRFDGLKMLKMLKGKRLVFVGDSLNRNMWESLVCALRASLADKSRVSEVSGHREFRTQGFYSFKFKGFKCSIDFIKSPFLVQERIFADKAGARRETLRLDLMQSSSAMYHDADIIIFNTGHWWTHQKTHNRSNYFQEGSRVYNKLEVTDAYSRALRTWARWVDSNINSSRTRVFFRGYSASHFKGGQWNSGGSCDGETQPITNDTHLSPYPWMMRALESVIAEMKTPVFYLNITRMTDYRKDGHPSIFRQSESQRMPGMIQDCSHWCLPGIPDSWNELLYAILINSHQNSLKQ